MLDDDSITQILNAFLLTAGVLMALSAIAITLYQRRAAAAEDNTADAANGGAPPQEFGNLESIARWRHR